MWYQTWPCGHTLSPLQPQSPFSFQSGTFQTRFQEGSVSPSQHPLARFCISPSEDRLSSLRRGSTLPIRSHCSSRQEEGTWPILRDDYNHAKHWSQLKLLYYLQVRGSCFSPVRRIGVLFQAPGFRASEFNDYVYLPGISVPSLRVQFLLYQDPTFS